MQRKIHFSFLSIAVLALTACTTTDSVVFVTKSSLGIDVDASTPGASVAYDRVEGYLAPRYTNSSAPAVYASFGSNGRLFVDRKIKQVYATGKAASQVSSTSTPGQDTATISSGFSVAGSQGGSSEDVKRLEKAMFFGTSTTLGLKVGYTGSPMDSLTFGFKRKEISLIPGVDHPDNYPSTITSFDNYTAAQNSADTALDVRQFFATGTAADNLSNSRDIKAGFQEQAETALAVYRKEELQQVHHVLTSLTCVAKLDDAKLPVVWDHAEALQLFDTADVMQKIRTSNTHDARAIYTDKLRQYKAASAVHTALLRGHMERVCKLAFGG